MMPGGDRTGPAGQGPQTGRQLGRCVPGEASRQDDEVVGRGQGLGRGPCGGGRGRGRGRGQGRGQGQGRSFGGR